MTRVWVSGRHGESCETTADCESTVQCENKKCGCQSTEKKITSTEMFGKTITRCIGKEGKCIDKDGKCIDKGGNCIDKDGKCIDKDDKCIDKDSTWY